MTPPTGRSWVVAANNNASSFPGITDTLCRDSYFTLSYIVITPL